MRSGQLMIVSTLLGPLTATLLCTSCEVYRHNMDDEKTAETAINKELGVTCHIGFSELVTSRGTQLRVVVSLDSPPPGTATEVRDRVTTIVSHAFRAPVDSVDVHF
jgi:hypothetical protein